MKRCNRCRREKESREFRRGSQCRVCDKLVKKVWEKNNREKHLASVRRRANARRATNPELFRAKEQAYRDANREAYSARQLAAAQRRHAADPEKRKAYGRLYRTRDREFYLTKRREQNQRRKQAARKYERERWHTDEMYRLKCRLRWFLREGIKGHVKSARASELLGCSLTDFKIYLESKFEVGMTWQNYGKHGWHIDHIMPLAIFDLSKPEHQKRAYHFSNMQPLWAAENLSKSDTPPAVHQFSFL
jgi:hypothetical protein